MSKVKLRLDLSARMGVSTGFRLKVCLVVEELMKTIKILILLSSLLMSVLANAADSSSSDPLEGMANLLKQEHQHPRKFLTADELSGVGIGCPIRQS